MLVDIAKYKAKTFKRGEVLLHAGEKSSHLFYLISGHVRRYVDSSDGKELTIHIFEEGSVFPLSWALNDEVPNFTLAALTDCKVVLVPKNEFFSYIKNDSDELLNITKRLARGLEGLSRRVEILSLEKADARVAAVIAYLAKHFGEKFNFTHEELSALTGLSRERVSIEMKKLKDKKAISYRRGVVLVKNRGLLGF